MSIQGTKAFVSEVLTSSDVNQYLMRGVKVFSSTAVRDAAYGGAGEPVLYEGETCYITATDELQTYNGSSWVKMGPAPTAVGKVLQVNSTAKTDVTTVSSGSYADISGLSVSITPSSTASKVLVLATISFNMAVGLQAIQIVRGSTAIFIGDGGTSRVQATFASNSGNTNDYSQSTAVFLDSPATTSATTYKLQARGTVQINRSTTDNNDSGFARLASSITVFEVSA